MPLYVPALLLSLAQGLLVPVLPLFAREFDAPFFWIGMVLAGDGFGLLLGDLPAGVIVRRLNQRRSMLLGIVIISLATLAMFWARTIPQVLLLRVAAGLGSALYNVSRHTFIADATSITHRGRSVALLGGTFRMGRMLGPLIGGSLAAYAGLRSTFLVYAVVCAVAVLLIWFFTSDPPASAFPARSAFGWRSVLRTLVSQGRILRWSGTGQFLLQLTRTGPMVVIPLYGADVLGLDVQQIGWVLGAASAIDMLLFYPTGIIMDRLGRKWAIVPSALVMAAGMLLISFANSMTGLVLASMLYGLGNGLGSGVMLTLGADLAPPETRGEFLGSWGLIGDAGATSGPVLFGSVADVLALQPATWVVAGTGLLSAMVFTWLVPETLKKNRPA